MIRLLIFAITTATVQKHVVDLVGEEILPDLQVFPVTILEAIWNFWEEGLPVTVEVKQVTVENLLK